jgi:hypothetical protein
VFSVEFEVTEYLVAEPIRGVRLRVGGTDFSAPRIRSLAALGTSFRDLSNSPVGVQTTFSTQMG